MASKEDVLKAAEKVLEFEMTLRLFGAMNVPSTLEARIKADAERMVVKEELSIASDAYKKTLREWIEAGQPDQQGADQ